ncbi:MAG: Ig-like domain-containing protein, partial [Treponema sp.]|nr:Ig-like domain-containing protein [Treponema sp.]
MQGTQKIVFGVLAVILALAFTACPGPTQPTPELEPPAITGSITGRAVFSDGTDSGGIIITLEGTDGLRSASALNAGRNLAAGARSIGTGSFAATTQTAVDGSFTLNDIPAGTYILHASSRDSMEQAVAIGVTVTAGEVLDLDTLRLTPVGRISGQIVVDGGDSDAWGFLVSVAGTSFMSVTDIRGMFTISGVPAGDDYHVIVTRGNFTALFTPYAQTVSGGQTTYLDTKYITGTELDISSVITIGPNGNWWINDVDTNIPAQGPQGPQGGQGPEGPTGFVPVEGISLNEDNLSLSIGQSQMLTVTVYPPNATITAILWSSGRPDIASIDMLTGWVTAHAPGVATITATTMQGNQTATSTVTVTATTAGPSSPLASRLLIFQVGASA